MRFISIFLLSSFFNVQAQISVGNGTAACTEADLVNGGTIECATLTISSSPVFANSAQALDVLVQDDVTINSDLNLSGGDSPDDANSASDDFYGPGGPGASRGGNSDFGSPKSAPGSSGGGVGANSNLADTCGGGGGGGGFAEAGTPGNPCGTVSGGNPGPVFSAVFSSPLRGGFGGGAGGDAGATIGAGGGGGGSIRIRAGGRIIINANIFANGGRGGSTTTDGGGGGGGSGGLIWLQALGDITNYGSLSADGGSGGASGNNGSGSAGGRGAIKIESSGIFINNGSLPSYAEFQLSNLNNRKLESSISCANVKQKNDNGTFLIQFFLSFLVIVGFMKGYRSILKFFTQTKAQA